MSNEPVNFIHSHSTLLYNPQMASFPAYRTGRLAKTNSFYPAIRSLFLHYFFRYNATLLLYLYPHKALRMMMKIFVEKILFLFLLSVCITHHSIAQKGQTENLVQYVNPMIGTQRMGHTYPGATMPFGMVQLSPDTDTIPYDNGGKYNPDVYKYCAGYQYDDKTIVGFSHTHFSGTGHSDLGDFLIMPTVGKLQLNPGTADNPESGYRSSFAHSDEDAEADYYKVKLSSL